ncbi:MAG TPA: carboxylesterase family protein [Bacteroidales bacterium]|nr:carboxylesterase family protein [Bacteroidales bacterium]
MNKIITLIAALMMMGNISVFSQLTGNAPTVKTDNGMLEGINKSGVKVFKGVPFAAPPVGELRWKAPQPVKNWNGIRKANKFGPRPMQLRIFEDMNFLSDSVSEDCLYLNIWTPAKTGKEKLPVLVYFYGGGFVAGSGDEPRYAGESMARQGIISITVNYRLGIFGFFAHPELTKESPHHSSGNYGYLDQAAALKWINENIEAFGGDSKRITIAGESAGSISVSAQMCSPLSRDLIAGVIGSSGSLLGALPPIPLQVAEKNGLKVAEGVGAKTLKDLRAISADSLLEVRGRFVSTLDGYFFPKAPVEIYAAGEQAHVPALIGWNSSEMGFEYLLGNKAPTVENFKLVAERIFGDRAQEIMNAYDVTDDYSVTNAANALASDLFIAFSTWKWTDIQSKTGGKPVYRYLYLHPRPELAHVSKKLIQKDVKITGAVHSADIEYAMGNLPTNRVFDWQPEDYEISDIFQTYYLNFVKTGNPNGLGVIDWPVINNKPVPPVLQMDVNTSVKMDESLQKRYKLLNEIYFPDKK